MVLYLYSLSQHHFYLTEDFGSSEFSTPAGKFECLDTAEAGTFYKVKGETKENIPTVPYGCHPSSQVSLSGFRSFRRSSSGGNDNFPLSNRSDKIAGKVWLTYTIVYRNNRKAFNY